MRPVPLSLASIAIAWLRFFLLGALWCWEPRASEARKRELLLLASGRVAATASQADIENAVKESEKESLVTFVNVHVVDSVENNINSLSCPPTARRSDVTAQQQTRRARLRDLYVANAIEMV